MKILNFGSLNIDYAYKVQHIVEKGETISSEALNIYPGGKGLNQSIALGKAGVEVYHAGAVGKEGMFLVEFLEKANVNTEYIRIVPKIKTGHAIIQNNAQGDNCIILYGGANQAITKEQVNDTLDRFVAGDYLILQNEINELAYIVEKAYAKGMVIVLNPSPMNEKITKLPLEKVDCFILNEIEASQILGVTYDNEADILNALAEKFIHAKVVLTLGEKGALYCDGKNTVVQKAYQAKAVDTTAAGDTFTGYFLSGEIRGLPIETSMDLAAKASAITVSRPGAGVSIPSIAEVVGMNF